MVMFKQFITSTYYSKINLVEYILAEQARVDLIKVANKAGFHLHSDTELELKLRREDGKIIELSDKSLYQMGVEFSIRQWVEYGSNSPDPLLPYLTHDNGSSSNSQVSTSYGSYCLYRSVIQSKKGDGSDYKNIADSTNELSNKVVEYFKDDIRNYELEKLL